MPTIIDFTCKHCGKRIKESISFGQIGNPVYDMQIEYGIVCTDFGDLCANCGKLYIKEKYRADKVAESHLNENFWRLKDREQA